MSLSYDLTTFQILGQKSVKIFGGFLENLKFPKNILKLSDLYIMTLLLDIKGTVHCNTDSLRMCKGLKLTDWNRCRTNCDVSINFSPLYINIISLIHLYQPMA